MDKCPKQLLQQTKTYLLIYLESWVRISTIVQLTLLKWLMIINHVFVIVIGDEYTRDIRNKCEGFQRREMYMVYTISNLFTYLFQRMIFLEVCFCFEFHASWYFEPLKIFQKTKYTYTIKRLRFYLQQLKMFACIFFLWKNSSLGLDCSFSLIPCVFPIWKNNFGIFKKTLVKFKIFCIENSLFLWI